MNRHLAIAARGLVLAAVLAPISCSRSHLNVDDYTAADSTTDPHGHDDLITEDDIDRVSATTAYDAIVKLRANFLSYRGETSFLGTSSPNPNVYVDDMAYGPVGVLKTIPASQIATIRLYRAAAAMQKFGTGNMGGVIEIYTKH